MPTLHQYHLELKEVIALRYFTRGFQKLIFELNRLMTRILLKNFESHPETIPLETNPNLGAGNGHAQSRDLTVLVPFLVLLRVGRCKSILDLGSGDGFVLKVAESLGFSRCYGVEADVTLCEISKRNLNRSVIYNEYFNDVQLEFFEKPVHLVYFFNPDLPVNMLNVCLKLRGLDCRYFLTKNHSFAPESTLALGIRLVLSTGSFRLYRAMGTSI